MPRSTNGPASRQRRKRVLKQAKGFRGFRKSHYRYAKQAVYKAMSYAYRDRKVRKRMFRRMWIQRLNAASRPLGLSYNRLIEGLNAAAIGLDRKVLSDMAIRDHDAFLKVVEAVKAALATKNGKKAAA
jgi:large subunit ribosomal protein L20